MTQTENISLEQNDLEQILKDFQIKINKYMQTLKMKSSDEILNGSVITAQKLLDKLVLMDEGIKKVNSAHEYLLALLDQEKIEPVPKPETAREIDKNNGSKEDFKFDFVHTKNNIKLRMQILKALIYLGGNAEESEMVEFITKEIGKGFDKANSKTNGNGASWTDLLRIECKNMIGEKLLIFDDSRDNWEITQNGIDYLAKQEN